MKETVKFLSAEKIVYAAELAEKISDLRQEENAIWRQMVDGKPSSEEMVRLILKKHAVVLEHNILVQGDSPMGEKERSQLD